MADGIAEEGDSNGGRVGDEARAKAGTDSSVVTGPSSDNLGARNRAIDYYTSSSIR